MGEGSAGWNSALNAIKRKRVDFTRAGTITDRTETAIHDAAATLDKPRYVVRPHPDEGGIFGSISLLEHFHEKRTRLGVVNTSETNAFEIGYDGRYVDFSIVPGTPETGRKFRDFLIENHPSSDVTQTHVAIPGLDSSAADDDTSAGAGLGGGFDAGRKMAGARLAFFRGLEFPINHINAGGFLTGARSVGSTSNRRVRPEDIRDPYKDIITAITRDEECCVTLQFLFRPIGLGAIRQGLMTMRANRLAAENNILGLYSYPASDAEEAAASVIRQQINEDLYQVEGRILVTAPTSHQATDRVADIGHKLRKYYSNEIDQGIYAVPVGHTTARSPTGRSHNRKLRKFATNVIGRKRRKRKGPMECSTSEFAGLAHLPHSGVNAQEIRWNRAKIGSPVPPGLPRFDYEAVGIDPDLASPHKKQIAIQSNLNDGDDYFLGFGVRKETEAGIHRDRWEESGHTFYGGTTRRGKTTGLINMAHTVDKRDHGCLFVDQKGQDAEQLYSVLEADPEDVVIMEIGSESDYSVSFNFLEPPCSPDLDPDSEMHKQAVDAMTDMMPALLALSSGGDEDYWGPRMNRVTRATCRGLREIGHDATLFDLFGALNSAEGKERFLNEVDNSDKASFLSDVVESTLESLSENDLEPTIGRLQEWVLNSTVRPLISQTESTVSIDEIVAEGKTLVVQNKSLDDTATLMVVTALILRIWLAIREQSLRASREDPPPFVMFLDEFHKLASSHARIPEILSQGAGFGLHAVISTQDLTGQLDDEIVESIESQCDKFISFDPGREADAKQIATQHSEDITAEDLTNLPRYQFYYRSELPGSQGMTQSVRCQAFAPLDELAPWARTDDEVEEFRQESLQLHGAKKRSTADIQRSSMFFDAPDTEDESGLDPDDLTDDQKLLVYKAIFDTNLRHHDATAWEQASGQPGVTMDALEPQLEQALPIDSEDVHSALLNHIVDGLTTDVGGEIVVDGISEPTYTVANGGVKHLFQTGSNPAAGKATHRELLKTTYKRLTREGYAMSLPIQGGIEADALGVEPTEFSPDPRTQSRQLRDFETDQPVRFALSGGSDIAIEAESSTGNSDPSQTVRNLWKAMVAGQQCLFVVPRHPDHDDRFHIARKVYQSATDSDRIERIRDEADFVDATTHTPEREDWHILFIPDDGGEPLLYVGPDIDPIPLDELDYDTLDDALYQQRVQSI